MLKDTGRCSDNAPSCGKRHDFAGLGKMTLDKKPSFLRGELEMVISIQIPYMEDKEKGNCPGGTVRSVSWMPSV